MIRIFPLLLTSVLLLHLGISASLADPIVETDIDHNSIEIRQVYVIAQPPQTTLMGSRSDLPLEPVPGRYGQIQLISEVDKLVLSGAAVAIQTALVLADKRRYEAGQNEDPMPDLYIDFAKLNKTLLSNLDTNSDWELAYFDQISFYDRSTRSTSLKKPVRRLLEDPAVDSVVAFRTTYFLAPGLNRVRILVHSRVSTRKSNSSALRYFDRTYEYVSAPEGVAMRPWHVGEREERIVAVEEAYQEGIAKHPENARLYGRERDAAMKFLESSSTIPPGQAIAEFWTAQRIADAYAAGSSALNEVIRRDLARLMKVDYPKSKFRRVDHYDLDGQEKRIRVREVGAIGSHVVLRDKDGSIFVLPES